MGLGDWVVNPKWLVRDIALMFVNSFVVPDLQYQ